MLKMALTKSSTKDQLALQQQSQSFKLPDDSSRLEKQLRTFIAKLQAGASFMPDVYRLVDDSTPASNTTTSTSYEEKQAPTTNRTADIERGKWEKVSSSSSTSETGERLTSRTTTRPTRNEYDFERDEESGEKVTTKKPEVKPRGVPSSSSSGLPTFEELMQSDEFNKKDQLNFESDED